MTSPALRGLVTLVLGVGLVGAVGSAPSDPSPPSENKGPVLYGEGAGRLWKWEGGEKTYLTAEGTNLVAGGVGETQAWGWSLGAGQARFFTLELPKKKPVGDPKAAEPKTAEGSAPPVPRFDARGYPVPDRADRVGDRILLVYGALGGQPRYEVWTRGTKTFTKAWDDGRTVYAAALGPQEGWIVAGRTQDGSPWLEVSGTPVPAPEGWRGRLTFAAYVPEAAPEKEAPAPLAPGAAAVPEVPLPVHPWAAGWGAAGNQPPQALFWGPEGWTQPAGPVDPSAGVYPLLGAPGANGAPVLAGWRADEGTGALRPWFWDGETATVPGGAADGQPQAFSLGDKGGAFLVVRHQSAPWFTLEDGHESVVLEGLGPEDRVVAVEAPAPTP